MVPSIGRHLNKIYSIGNIVFGVICIVKYYYIILYCCFIVHYKNNFFYYSFYYNLGKRVIASDKVSGQRCA